MPWAAATATGRTSWLPPDPRSPSGPDTRVPLGPDPARSADSSPPAPTRPPRPGLRMCPCSPGSGRCLLRGWTGCRVSREQRGRMPLPRTAAGPPTTGAGWARAAFPPAARAGSGPNPHNSLRQTCLGGTEDPPAGGGKRPGWGVSPSAQGTSRAMTFTGPGAASLGMAPALGQEGWACPGATARGSPGPRPLLSSFTRDRFSPRGRAGARVRGGPQPRGFGHGRPSPARVGSCAPAPLFAVPGPACRPVTKAVQEERARTPGYQPRSAQGAALARGQAPALGPRPRDRWAGARPQARARGRPRGGGRRVEIRARSSVEPKSRFYWYRT